MKTVNIQIWATILVLGAILMSSCKKDFEKTAPDPPTVSASADTTHYNVLRAFQTKTGIEKHGTFKGRPIIYEEVDGQAVWQGDIMLSKEDLAPVDTIKSNANTREKGIGAANTNRRWKNGIVPYVVDINLDLASIESAMSKWEEATPIQFKVRTNETDYIWFRRSTEGNSSRIGRQGGQQVIYLKEYQDVGIIVHEIGHSLGLEHEHNRKDRNDYVTFNQNNLINPIYAQQYAMTSPVGDFRFDSGNFDFNSIMIYGSFQYAKKNEKGEYLPVLTKKDGSIFYDNLNKKRPSVGDERAVTAMYSNIYVVKSGRLLGVSPKDGKNNVQLSNNWSGTSQVIAEDGQIIWLIKGGMLWRTDRFNGNSSAIGNGNWNGAVGVTGMDPKGYMYAQAGDYIWKIDRYGRHQALGDGSWKGTKVMYYLNGALYAISGQTLYKVDTNTGAYSALGFGDWRDAKAMTAASRFGTSLYIIAGNELWRVNTSDGKLSFIKGGFKNTTAMTGLEGKLYIASDGYLYKIYESGSVIFKSIDFFGVSAMGSTNFSGL